MSLAHLKKNKLIHLEDIFYLFKFYIFNHMNDDLQRLKLDNKIEKVLLATGEEKLKWIQLARCIYRKRS